MRQARRHARITLPADPSSLGSGSLDHLMLRHRRIADQRQAAERHESEGGGDGRAGGNSRCSGSTHDDFDPGA